MPSILNIIALTALAGSLSARALDPLLPHIADEFGVSIASVASFVSAFSFTFAIIQPAIGAAADLLGKVRLMLVCLILLGIANILGASTHSFGMLFVTRILAGVASGGIFPVLLGLASDLVAPERRQVAISRVLAGSLTGNLLGASASGMIGDVLGWRGVLAVLGGLMVVTAAVVALAFRNSPQKIQPVRADLAVLRRGYRTIFSNPNAIVVFSAVFLEGSCIFGLFAYIASFLVALGERSLSAAGIVIAGFAVGGLLYTLTVGRLMPRLGTNGMMLLGAGLLSLQLVLTAQDFGWKAQTAVMLFMGWGFYLLHGSIQVFSSELSVEARATALSLHSFFFFLGQTAGPIGYGIGIAYLGKTPTLLVSAATMLLVGYACTRLLRASRPADAALHPEVEP